MEPEAEWVPLGATEAEWMLLLTDRLLLPATEWMLLPATEWMLLLVVGLAMLFG